MVDVDDEVGIDERLAFEASVHEFHPTLTIVEDVNTRIKWKFSG
jgi:hypothetical protein